MLKSFKKKSLKAKIGIIAAIVILLLLLVYVLYSNFKPEPAKEYEVAQVNYGTITDYLDVNGIVEAGNAQNLFAIEGVTVEEVLVNVGDTVKKGDKLATFNVQGAAGYVNDAKAEYDKALKEYNDATKSSSVNSDRKAELEKEISAVNLKISAKEAEIEKLSAEIESAGTVETAPIPNDQINAIAMQMLANGASLMQVIQFREAASNVEVPVVDDALKAKQEELMQKNLELAQLNAQLSALYAENTSTVVTDESVIKALEKVKDAKLANYENVKNIYDSMSNGWYASNDGVVNEINIKPGEPFVPVKNTGTSSFDISSLIGGGIDSETMELISTIMGNSSAPSGVGMTINSYDDLMVTVTLGKSDLLKVQVGMEAIITSLDSVYEGEVVYVSAAAQDSSGSLNLGSITSLMGGTGANGAVVKVKIKNPDRNVVVGFDVDIKIALDTINDVLKVPVEAVIYNSGTYSVFVYDEKEETVTKKVITRGSLDDKHYEVVEGLTKGEWVVKSPDPSMEDGTKISKKGA